MWFRKKKKTMCVHDGGFHADDVFACATVSILSEKDNFNIILIRSRDQEVINNSDIVADVGMIYDRDKDRFDHHQIEGAGTHYNGVPYASFGLVWEKYGKYICDNEYMFLDIENTLVIPIDGRDNGVSISSPTIEGVYEYNIGSVIHSFNIVPTEDDGLQYKNFIKAVEFAKNIIKREIEFSKHRYNSELKIKSIIEKSKEDDILVLDESLEWEYALTNYKNIKLVVYPSKNKESWSVQVTRDDKNDYKSRRFVFPLEWRGLRDGDLATVSGVNDAIFCIKDGWLIKTKTKESAISIAKLALHKD